MDTGCVLPVLYRTRGVTWGVVSLVIAYVAFPVILLYTKLRWLGFYIRGLCSAALR